MTRTEHIRHLFALHGELSIRRLADLAITEGVFTPDDVRRRGVRSIQATCRRALSAVDEETGLHFAYRVPRVRAREKGAK